MKTLAKLFLLSFLVVCGCQIETFAGWQKVNSNTLAWLHSVYFVNQNKGWIVGSRGTFLETVDAGNNWKVHKNITEDNILDVHFADENHGWILCEKDVFSGSSVSPSYILETFDGGESWSRVKILDEGKERLVRFFFTKEGKGWATGEAGTLYEMQDNAASWKQVNIAVRYLLLDGAFTDKSRGLVVGGGGSAYFTEDGGVSWKPSFFVSRASEKLNSVFFINKNIGWTVGASGKIYSTNNGGKSWREQNSNVSKNLFDVFFINTAEGWAIGDEGTILHTTTAGNIWNEVEANTRHKLERAFFAGQKGWIVGFGGTIMVYEAGTSEKPETKQSPILQKRSFSSSQ